MRWIASEGSGEVVLAVAMLLLEGRGAGDRRMVLEET